MDLAVHEWLDSLDIPTYEAVMTAVVVLSREGPSLGRPLVDTIADSPLANLKELRPPSPGRQTVRILFAFDPTRTAFFLAGGDKTNDWRGWYRRNIPLAQERYANHLRALERRKDTL